MGKVLQELGYEKDLNVTLGKEHTSVKAKFLAANEQCENLQQRFQHLQMESKAKVSGSIFLFQIHSYKARISDYNYSHTL